MSHLRMDQEQLDAIQARIKASSSTTTVRNMQTELGEKQADSARLRNTGRTREKQIGHLSEAVVLRDCSALLDRHPKVAFWYRQNTGGALTMSGRYVKFSFKGASDLVGMSINGRFLAIECKATGKKATADQQAFLDNVRKNCGFAVCVDHAGMLELALREL